jgi:mono/diheme cytochrome c family protein
MEVTVRGVIGGAVLATLAGCDGQQVEPGRVEAILALEGDPVLGQAQYEVNCATCHGQEAQGGSGPTIRGYEDAEGFVVVVIDGKGDMGSFASLLDQDIADLLAFVQSL